jgi:hypothetical protein
MKTLVRKAVVVLPLTVILAVAQYSISLAQTKSEPAGVLNPQKTELTLQFSAAPSTKVTLDASEVERMIEMLAELRAGMNPPRPMVNPPPGTIIHVATAGRWWLQPVASDIDLDVLHPGYGWVGVRMDRASIEELSHMLARYRPVALRAKHSPGDARHPSAKRERMTANPRS